MTSDYVTNGAAPDDVLAMLYEFPLAPIYRERRDLFFRSDGRVHGVIPGTQTIFHIKPENLTLWCVAYDANLALFPLTHRA